MTDYYKILEIQKNATQDDIKKAYRLLATKYHPDKNPAGAAKFIEIKEAYEALETPEKRTRYDDILSGKIKPESRPVFKPDPSDINIILNNLDDLKF